MFTWVSFILSECIRDIEEIMFLLHSETVFAPFLEVNEKTLLERIKKDLQNFIIPFKSLKYT